MTGDVFVIIPHLESTECESVKHFCSTLHTSSIQRYPLASEIFGHHLHDPTHGEEHELSHVSSYVGDDLGKCFLRDGAVGYNGCG